MNVNYVIAAYFGERKRPTLAYRADPRSYLEIHLESLERLDHRLNQITVVVSKSVPFVDTIGMPNKIKDTPVVYLERENTGMSYGAFSDAFDLYKNKFDRYIFMEDDYIFTRDKFDRILSDNLESLDYEIPTGFICGSTQLEEHNNLQIAATFLGMARTVAIEDAVRFYDDGRLPYDHADAGYEGGCRAQKEQSFAFQYAMWKVRDWTMNLSTAYYNAHYNGPEGVVRWFGDLNKPSLVIPVQVINQPVTVFHEDKEYVGMIHQNGSFSQLTEKR